MSILLVLLIVISLNLATLRISTTLEINKIIFPKSSILMFSILSTFIMFISMVFGKLLETLLGYQIANTFGSVLLLFIGISNIVEDIKLEKMRKGYDTSYYYENPFWYNKILDYPCIVVLDKSNHIDLIKSIDICFAVSLNNFCTYFAASLCEININLILLFYFIFSILVIILTSLYYKSIILKLLKIRYKFVSGLILIFLSLLKIVF